jgi:aminoglycoside 6'-N-acetyltransferase I
MLDIRNVTIDQHEQIAQAARILHAGFALQYPEAWPTIEEALAELHEVCANEGGFCRAAFDGEQMLGWYATKPGYSGNVWELHPIVVAPAQQGRGIGRALLTDLEQQVAQRGGLTITLGTDDTAGLTSLSGSDIYANLWQQIAQIRNLGGHPFSFYQSCGYQIVGVVPDANGYGKPDILMAKRVVREAFTNNNL